MDAIKTRRSIGKVKDVMVPAELIEKILEAGTYAPNHYRTEPWRFFVITGKGRKRLGDVLEEIVKEENAGLPLDEIAAKSAKAKNNPLRAPVIIAVGVEPRDKNNVILQEEYAAVSSAVQNMLLCAHSLGLGAVWRTGKVAYHDKMNDFFGLSANGGLIAFIYIGYPDMEPKTIKRLPFEKCTTWID
jgi:nitroreductase